MIPPRLDRHTPGQKPFAQRAKDLIAEVAAAANQYRPGLPVNMRGWVQINDRHTKARDMCRLIKAGVLKLNNTGKWSFLVLNKKEQTNA
jgi:hypothetical protein